MATFDPAGERAKHHRRLFEGRAVCCQPGEIFLRGSILCREFLTNRDFLLDGGRMHAQGYRSEINRLRRHLPRVCNALDAYSKGRASRTSVRTSATFCSSS